MNDPVILTGDEVIKIDKELSFVNAKLLQFRQMDEHIQALIELQVPNYRLWTNEGVNADVLCPGRNWQKGKLKLVLSYRVEFTPASPATLRSPLDDLRTQI
ncbi:KGK domain-containing protein [Nostoc sp. 106C]|uniref:KGK domain-containing protein n=1 Tax=Nostoc sp. 106C TaxID=1932667 RepID=UPI000A3A2B0F|nr:KGK domain-containing protein [Nostoc sp. 106C]OUL34092.1 hypothetical protein BV375_05280 [Nostoc sp. 106C]